MSRRLLAALGAAALLTGTATSALAAEAPAASGSSGSARSAGAQQQLDSLVADNDFPGAIAVVRGADGKVRTYTAGTGDLATGAPVPRDSRVRIASNTKMFTATVVLQLVGEGEVDLDATVERYLPGLLRGPGGDGRTITVRQLLQQTSGLPDYDELLLEDGGTLASFAHTYVEPHDLLDAALAEKRHFRPGAKWEYSNTNYVVLGLLAQRVTGRPIGEEITRRVIDRAGLDDTYWPRPGEQRIRGSHPHGYLADAPGAPWQDLTRMDPAFAWSAGALVSTPADLGRFMAALVGGELLAPAQLAEMQDTVRAPGFDAEPGWRYGLGLASHDLDCGGLAWGHGGDIQGFETRNLVTEDGRFAVVAVTGLPTSLEMVADVSGTVEELLCGAS